MIEIAAPREAVWQAVTEPEMVNRWLGCLAFQPLAGHVFHLQPDRVRRDAGDIDGAITCRIEVLDAPRQLTFSWGFPETPDTWVTLRLRRIAGGTHVRLTHSGWDQFEATETEAVRSGLGHAWHTAALPALKALAEALPPDGAPADV